jgi:hypothetical protein
MRFILKLLGLPLRTIIRFFRDLDGAFSTFFRKLLPNQHVIVGACKKRGLCCNNIAVYIPKGMWKHKYQLSFITLWYEWVYNFTRIDAKEEEQVLLFACNYLKENKCSIYWRRPFICRNYPLIHKHFRKPTFLPGCGFSIEKRKN